MCSRLQETTMPCDEPLVSGSVPADATPAEWAELLLRGYVEQSQKAGKDLREVSRDLIRSGIGLLAEEALAAMHLDPSTCRAMMTDAMRHIADKLDAEPVERPRLQ